MIISDFNVLIKVESFYKYNFGDDYKNNPSDYIDAEDKVYEGPNGIIEEVLRKDEVFDYIKETIKNEIEAIGEVRIVTVKEDLFSHNRIIHTVVDFEDSNETFVTSYSIFINGKPLSEQDQKLIANNIMVDLI